ncbi:protein of unknown function [Amphibacillus marinus]|uniref:Transcobalamin-like C-terminal domain-containing protein n=1 Tax=Amphibacillus marinus TaxID=872970 RepID=A0A1H8GD30_9BACI|nr:DUF4430 domain-containing protein [Amphibacillus marinus]SEN41665.1 protein of unknown function [Amphibacillus marinus]
MKKILLAMSFLVMLVGCQSGELNQGNDIEVSIIISLDNEEEVISEDSIRVSDGANLLSVLEENYEIEVTDDGFITAIEGYEQFDNHYWFYEVNNEEANVGAGDYELSDGDSVHFDLHSWE